MKTIDIVDHTYEANYVSNEKQGHNEAICLESWFDWGYQKTMFANVCHLLQLAMEKHELLEVIIPSMSNDFQKCLSPNLLPYLGLTS